MSEEDNSSTGGASSTYPSYGVSVPASLAINTVITAQYTAIEMAGARAVGRMGGPITTVVLGSVDVADAYQRGTTGDVVVQVAGIGGGIVGGWLGGMTVGGGVGLIFGHPVMIGLGTVAGGVLGAYFGEDWVQEKVDGIVKGPSESVNSTAFWNAAIQDVQASNVSPSEKAAILRDLVMAREIPSYRQEIAKKYWLSDQQCFPSGTLISLPDGKTLAIEDIVPANHVAAFGSGSAAGLASSPLEARPVTSLFHNLTTEWIELVWQDPATGEQRVLTSTPGHVMLTPEGKSHVELHGSEAQDLPQRFVFRQLIDMIVPGTASSADCGHQGGDGDVPLTKGQEFGTEIGTARLVTADGGFCCSHERLAA
ncbi:MAG: Hint domain-containing protein [Nitratireductor sp.]